MLANGADGWLLVATHAWQIALVGALVGVAVAIVGRRSPHVAYALWLVVLAKCFLPPLWGWPTSSLAWLTPPLAFSSTGGHDASTPAGTEESLVGGSSTTTQPERIGRDTAQRASASSDFPVERATAVSREWLQSAAEAAPMVWLAGSVLLVGIAVGRGTECGRGLRRSSRPIPLELARTVDRLASRLGLRQRFQVLITSTDVGPFVMGIWRPRVYIPETLLDSMQAQHLEAMLAHELAHVRRRDTWIATIQFAAQALWWFHPVVWWMNRQLVRQRERCCDEETVANLNGNRSVYARSLVQVLEAKHRLAPLWGYPAVRPVELTRRRLEEIMNRSNMVHSRASLWCWVAAGGLAFLVLPGISPVAVAEPQSPGEKIRLAQAKDKDRPPTVLKYGDGKADGKKSYGGSGHLIRFEMPEGITKVKGLRIHGSRYGLPQAPKEDFEITFLNDDMDETLDSKTAPYHQFKRGKEQWVRVLFKEPVELPEKFWIALNFNPHQTKGVYLSYDTESKGEHSRVGLAGDDKEPKKTDFEGDWMVQVLLEKPE